MVSIFFVFSVFMALRFLYEQTYNYILILLYLI